MRGYDQLINGLVENSEFLAGLPRPVVDIGFLVALGAALLGVVSGIASVLIYLERKVSGRIQSRHGPTRVGPYGLLVMLADALKLISKEDLIPRSADRPMFILAPFIVFATVFATLVAIPFGPELIIADMNVGLFYVLAIGSVEVVGVILAGWASNNKWSLFGAMREVAQIVSYELPLAISAMVPIVLFGSLSAHDIGAAQIGGIWKWGLFQGGPFSVVAFFIFFIAGLAECKRAPFDLPEAESELVAGFHTEYSGMRFGYFFLAEYAAMFVVSLLATVLFCGGWDPGFPWPNMPQVVGVLVVLAKTFFFLFVMIWVRWTLPRYRVDQVMSLCYKVLLPFALVCLVGATAWTILVG